MIPSQDMLPAAETDAALVQESLAGDRNAFGRIVARYQSLICSLAYSSTGDLGRSEDLAQETFVAAWKDLRSLHDPAKIKAWLCGIVRNLVSGSRRKDGREPSHRAEAFETAGEFAAAGPSPADQAVSREEEMLLWRSLEGIPESYREPLVMFYREHQSVERVAAELDLSEDAVRQRLSRGRKLLEERVLAMVEGTLKRTTPGPAFTMSVLGALPLAATGAGMGAVGGASAKGVGWLAVSGFLLAPAAGFLSGFLGYKIEMAQARSETERRAVRRFAALLWTLIIVGISVPLVLGRWGSPLIARHPESLAWLIAGLGGGYLAVMVAFCIWARREGRRMAGLKAGAFGSPADLAPVAFEFRSKASLLGLPLVHIRFCRRGPGRRLPTTGWISAGDVAFGVIAAFGRIAVAPLGLGIVGIGLVAWGACGLGVFATGGLAFGGWAFGGIAIGWHALGALSLGWRTAMGGWAAAYHFAQASGVAYAVQPTGSDARELRQEAIQFVRFAAPVFRWVSLVWVGVALFNWRMYVRARKRS